MGQKYRSVQYIFYDTIFKGNLRFRTLIILVVFWKNTMCFGKPLNSELDGRIRGVAADSGAAMALGRKCVDVAWDSAGRVEAVILADVSRVGCRWLIVADGARSPLGVRCAGVLRIEWF